MKSLICRCFSLLVLVVAGQLILDNANADDPYQPIRDRLVNEKIATAGVRDSRVLDAIRKTPRHYFVPKSQRNRAYLDMALPIGEAQTISSPFIVASMTEALDPQPTDKVLEIGTGSGYQAAVLSPLVEKVYTIEIVESLGNQATRVLSSLNYDNVSVRIGDGFLGWPSAAPFDKIIVTCSPESVPQPLVDQLAEGGLMIIPVGQRYQQTLYRMTKEEGKLVKEALRPTLFVPMTGEAEDSRIEKPDPTNPVVLNGDFEVGAKTQEDESIQVDFVPGWYYGRQVQRIERRSPSAIDSGKGFHGDAFVRFSNETPGLSSHLLQGLAIDAKKVHSIRLSGRYRTESVKRGPTADAQPMISISFYDEKRRDLGTFSLGPFRKTYPWRTSSRIIRIPTESKEAIVRIGLFGATGIVDFDRVQIEKMD